MKKNAYLEIVDDMRRKIDLGLMREHDRLPSCRELAMRRGLNPNTVQRAYSALEAEGYLYSIEKKGVYVAPRDKAAALESIAREKIAELKEAGLTRALYDALGDELWGKEEP